MNTLNQLQMAVISQPNTVNGAAGYTLNRGITVVPPCSWMHPTTPPAPVIETTLTERLTQTVKPLIKPAQYMRAATATGYSPAPPLSRGRKRGTTSQVTDFGSKTVLAKTITAVPTNPRTPIDPLFNNKAGKAVLTRSASVSSVSPDRQKVHIPKKNRRPLPPLPDEGILKAPQERSLGKKSSPSSAKTTERLLSSLSATPIEPLFNNKAGKSILTRSESVPKDNKHNKPRKHVHFALPPLPAADTPKTQQERRTGKKPSSSSAKTTERLLSSLSATPTESLSDNKAGKSILTRRESVPKDNKHNKPRKHVHFALPPLPAGDTPKTQQERRSGKKPSSSSAKTTARPLPSLPATPTESLSDNKAGKSILTRRESVPKDNKHNKPRKHVHFALPPLPAEDTPKTQQERRTGKKPSPASAKTTARPLPSLPANSEASTNHQTATRQLSASPLPPPPSSPDPKAPLQSSLSASDAKPAGSPNAGGHTESFIFLGPSTIGKLGLNNEIDTYTHRKQYGLDTIIPKHRLEHQLSKAEKRAVRQYLAMGKPGHQLIAMERVGGNIRKENKRELDIKIGSATASVRQDKEEYGSIIHAVFKKIRHKGIDRLTGSNWRHFRLEAAKLKEEKLATPRLQMANSTEKHLETLLTLPKKKRRENFEKIKNQLEQIRQTMEAVNISFIGSSVIIVIDDENPENTEVKLIDLAHPVHKGKDSQYFKKVQDRFIAGIDNLQKQIKTIEATLGNITPKS